jgi:hypothetical protein
MKEGRGTDAHHDCSMLAKTVEHDGSVLSLCWALTALDFTRALATAGKKRVAFCD